MTQAIGILELTSIARGIELGDVMLKSANVQLLLCRTLCPGKYLLMLGGDVGAVQQAIAAGTARTRVTLAAFTAWSAALMHAATLQVSTIPAA